MREAPSKAAEASEQGTTTAATPSPDTQAAVEGLFLLRRAREVSQRLKFRCFLDEELLTLVPQRYQREESGPRSGADLIVDPSLRFQADRRLPPELWDKGLVLESFLPGSALAWVEDAGTGIWVPYWLREH